MLQLLYNPRLRDLPMTLYLVSCVSQKLPVSAPAKDLYISSLFCKARSYVEGKGQPWFILSAKHGLVHPEQVIEPYDLTLNNLGIRDRRQWAEGVLSQLEPHLGHTEGIIFLAGHRYREFLEQALVQRGVSVSVPMEGLKIGEQLSWLNQHASG